MTSQDTYSFTFQSIPDVTGPIIITTEKDSSGNGECNWSDTTKNVIVSESIELSVSSDVEKSARSIVWSGSKSISIREETVDNMSEN